jgi:flagellar motility protein MotE (MotC chaperone)
MTMRPTLLMISASGWGSLALSVVLMGTVALTATHAAEKGWMPVVAPAYEGKSNQPAAKAPLSKAPQAMPVPAAPQKALEVRIPDVIKPVLTTGTIEARPQAESNAPLPGFKVGNSVADQYCANIVDAAMDARMAWQKKAIAEAERELDKRIALLEEKTAEYQKWLARRDEFSKKAQDTLVRIFSRMKADAAAAQLVALDEETAAAVLVKLDPRNSSAILNEMGPAHAARLTATIAGAARVSPDRPGSKS